MKNAHVIGLGKSGVAAARLLHREGWQVVLSDRGSSPSLVTQQAALRQDGITVLLDYSFVPDSRTNLLVVSPGVPWDSPALVAARENGLEVIGETELAWRFLQDRPWVGITGTNGKTTTTALTAAIFQAAGLNAPACGNIGYAACELALEPTVPDWVIAELSSYQIEASATLAPKIGLWTTLTPDHLQRHGTVQNYAQIKATLMHRSELAVFNGDDPYLRQHMPEEFPSAYWTSAAGKRAIAPLRPSAYVNDGWVKFEGIPIVRADALRMVGEHNQQNLLLAVTAACLAELDAEAIAAGVASFPGVPHRLEHICTWQGIDFINDSKATNYDAAEVGLRSVEAPAVLIAGGEAKEGDDTAWVQRIHERAATVLLIGDAAPQFAQRLETAGYRNYTIVEDMERAVERGAEVAPALGASVVLLSPACASFDQYPNFEQRGEHFRRLCQERFL
ncbi:UDP-N-acetylmuramoyl-L-alanine--D-glutamate ligase [Phormidium tenue]|uniref:UDP-N-acetylmuramoylalanine--D-glutamate ligase n=1 Tax=Phormidium tenue NIES-30 TaxID=549789 RepID=A0A1U7J2H3_9CYAN|nr:UDP-N-acetylmuramoyl-L-alanine--D-glutamate ligase [Phormidium tenue]MBD2231756.1 UDP-N-acetylmuramoyl-L-alanine--D-glutamate ligase [Phormidium tenue FACHB-1052]OKH46329.1 UDP-N-acetylmuramoylalanine--D-glutamate ligase [Phormidium tenue NIES-30]